jgi:hypothetical protein
VAKVKTPKPTISKKTRSKSRQSPYKDLKDMLSWRKHDPGPKFIEAMCQDYLEWSQRLDSTDLLDFRHSYGIPSKTFDDQMKKYEKLKDTHEFVREVVGSRRQKMAMYKKYECDPKTIHRTLHIYHPSWRQAVREENEFRASMSEKEKNQNPTKLTVVMKNYDDSISEPDTTE